VLRSDGQLSTALCAALSAHMQRNHRGVFWRQKRWQCRAGLGQTFRPLPASLSALVWDAAHGMRCVIWPFSSRARAAELLEPDHEGLWRPSFRHRQAGRPVKNNALWTLPLPPTPDFPGFEAEESLAPAFVVNPHRTGLWHKARPAANGLGDEGRGV
jgi:hypothetical protein